MAGLLLSGTMTTAAALLSVAWGAGQTRLVRWEMGLRTGGRHAGMALTWSAWRQRFRAWEQPARPRPWYVWLLLSLYSLLVGATALYVGGTVLLVLCFSKQRFADLGELALTSVPVVGLYVLTPVALVVLGPLLVRLLTLGLAWILVRGLLLPDVFLETLAIASHRRVLLALATALTATGAVFVLVQTWR